MAMEFLVPIFMEAIEQNPECVTGGERRGVFSVQSAKQQLILFLVFYLFTQGEEGVAPIERVVPDARRMPLYRLMNDPFHSLELGVGLEAEAEKVKESRPLAENRLRKVS